MEKTLENGNEKVKPDTTPFERMFDSGKEKKIPYSRLAGNLLSDNFMTRKEALGELKRSLEDVLGKLPDIKNVRLGLESDIYGVDTLRLIQNDMVRLSFSSYPREKLIIRKALREDVFHYKDKRSESPEIHKADKQRLENTLKEIFQDISSSQGTISFTFKDHGLSYG